MLRFGLLALGTFALLADAPQASAGSCCQSCAAPCAPMVQWWAPRAYYSATQFYVVNEGPTYSGPGIITLPPNYYPYVGGDCCTEQAPIMPYHYVPRHHVMSYPGGTYEPQEETFEDNSYMVRRGPRVRHGRIMYGHRPHVMHHRPVRVLLPRDK